MGCFMQIAIIIPAYNEEDSIGKVVEAIPKESVDRILVVNNGSSDLTERRAREAGAETVLELRRGYGSACMRGVVETGDADVLVFLDGDFSDDPSEVDSLIEPIASNHADLVIGSRALGEREKGALPFHAHFGNRVACFLMKVLFGVRFSDLGPFRAVRRISLDNLQMEDRNFGWTVEMQAKAAMFGLRIREVPVSYRKRIGRSKISGTFVGSVRAGTKILWTIFRLALTKNSIQRSIPME